MTQMLPRTTKSHSIERQENWAKRESLAGLYYNQNL